MSDARDAPSARGTAAAALVIVAAGVAAYANGLTGPFVFDDKGAILRNESIRSLSAIGDVLFSAKYATVVGRPVLNLSLALSYAMSGFDVVGWHVVNVVIHVLAGLALFGVARRTLTAPLAPAKLSRHATGLALAIALIWIVHPLQTESVTYICQRAESLAGLLVLTTLYCAIRGAEKGCARGWNAAAIASCLLAVGTKETAAAAPLLVLLHDRAFFAGSFREALRRRPRLYAGLASTWIVLAALVHSTAGRAGSAGLSSGVGVLDYAETQPRAIVQCLGLSFWPHPLIFDRGARLATTPAEIVPYAALIAALVVATVVALRSRPQLGFLGAWFFGILAPTSSVVPLATQTVAEHRMYLPLAAVVALAVIAGHAVTKGRAVPSRVAVGLVVVTLAWATNRRNETYRDELALWRDTADRMPENDRAQTNCGSCLLDAGDLAGALERFDRAVSLAPANTIARVCRGNALRTLGRYDEAAQEFTEMLRVTPEYSAVAYDERGLVRQAQNRPDLALADFDAAIREFHDFARAYADRAVTRFALGDADGARADVESCRRLGGEPPRELVSRLALDRK